MFSFEKFNHKKLSYIYDNFEDIKLKLRPETINDFDYPIEPLLKKYYDKSKRLDSQYSEIKVNYKRNNNMGRWTAEGRLSLQSMPREIREAISDDIYYDIDIVNCHYTLLYQYSINKKLQCKYIKIFCKKREQIFNELIETYNLTKDEIKAGFLALINNGGAGFLNKIKNSFIDKFNLELQSIQKYIFENEIEFSNMGQKIAKKKKEQNLFYNPIGSTMSLFLQDMENKILECMIDYLISKNIIKKYHVKIFDGFMIPKSDVENLDVMIDELKTEVLNKTGYKIDLICKPMDKKIIINPEDLINDDELVYPEITNNNNLIAMNDDEAANILYNLINNDILICEGTIYYKDSNIWISDKNELENLLIKKLTDLDIKKYKLATKQDFKLGLEMKNINGVDYCANKFDYFSKNYKSCKDIIKVFYSKIKKDDEFKSKIYYSTKGKIFFNNGYYDLIKNEFINNFDNVYTTKKINRDYKPNFLSEHLAIKNDIYNRILKPVFGDEIDDVLLYTSRAMGGMTCDKNFAVLFGERDSGKSKYQSLCETAFGSYVGTINMNSLIINDSNNDEAKKLSWLFTQTENRLLFGSEIRMNDKKKESIDGVLLKRICSGSDKIKMRMNHINEQDKYIQCSLFLLCNDMPEIQPSDTYESMLSFRCPNKFVDVITDEDKINNPHYRLKDYTIDNFVGDNLVGEVFTYIIIESFLNNKVVKKESMKNLLNLIKEDNDFSLFFESFIITKDDNDRVSNNDIKDWLKINSNLNISIGKMQLLLCNRGCTYKEIIRIDGKVHKKGYLGIKKLILEDEVNELDL